MSTALATWEPANLGEAMRYAEMLAKSPLMPKHLFNQAASVFLIMAKGRELGVPPLVAIDGIDVIQGKVALKPQLMLGLVRKRTDVCKYLICTETTDKIATFETHRVGDPKPTSLSFTIEDARKMQLIGKDNYSKQPAVMLRWRAASAICRLIYSDLLNGAYVFGEIPGGHTDEEIPKGVPGSSPGPVADAGDGGSVSHSAEASVSQHYVEPVEGEWSEVQGAIDHIDEPDLRRRYEQEAHDAEPEVARVSFGKKAGTAVTDLTIKDLQWYLQSADKAIADPEKARFVEQNRAWRDAVAAEIARRG